MLDRKPIAAMRAARRRSGHTWFAAAAIAFSLTGVLLLFTEHRGHVLGILPFALALSCPLVHVVMHGRHKQHHASAPSHQDEHR